jgi:glutathione synthase/RimK-type ligase-like ATP-grasp enzyme
MSDPHVNAVVQAMGSRRTPVVLDASTLAATEFSISSTDYGDARSNGTSLAQRRGWIRRLYPTGWYRGIVSESHAAAVKSSWMTLLADFLRSLDVRWLSNIDPLVASESKLSQMRSARSIGVPYPRTIVSNQAARIREHFTDEVVLKPLGPGHYVDSSSARVVFATSCAVDDPRLELVNTVPFICQERLRARRHVRIVTVETDAWAAQLDATDRPLDWRKDRPAHREFQPWPDPPEDAISGAIKLTSALKLGYSSQDWILTDQGLYFLDLNPGGQWLFLPDEISTQVTAALAAWMLRTDNLVE